jgi:hypothetical protein
MDIIQYAGDGGSFWIGGRESEQIQNYFGILLSIECEGDLHQYLWRDFAGRSWGSFMVVAVAKKLREDPGSFFGEGTNVEEGRKTFAESGLKFGSGYDDESKEADLAVGRSEGNGSTG